MHCDNLTPQLAFVIVAALGVAAWIYSEWFE